MRYEAGQCDIAVIGAGHAGIEAALAAARLGLDTVCFTVNLDAVGNMPCNPAIGGTGKGHLVRELDALGGEMAKAADKACIQYRMLNRGKGPAVHSLRAQADRRRYQAVMKHTLETQEHLRVKQAEVVSVETEDGHVSAVVTATGAVWRCRAAILATGTYLRGRTIVGEVLRDEGPDGLAAAGPLADCCRALGLSMRRFKTGTPPRILKRTVDFSKMELQPGDEGIEAFSFSTTEPVQNRAVCWLTYTNERTHEIIRANLDRSPIYSHVIEGVGPRYCPSIETKIMTFPDKERHQLFLEPMGLETEELYLQGFSSSLPEEVQVQMLHTIPGLERAEMTRCAYAIEYDCVDPTELWPTLETKKIPGLLNAARKLRGETPMILRRSDGYIGTLIDDLVTKGTNEPYRIMTSRSEYRLLHRQDNADERLSAIGREIGLVSEAQFAAVQEEYRQVAEDADLLRRPQIAYADLAPFDSERPDLPRAVTEQAEIRLKYAGYIDRQMRQVEEFQRLEERPLPDGLDFESIACLRLEARQKLQAIRPKNLGQASRISGVSPADVAALMVYLKMDSDAK